MASVEVRLLGRPVVRSDGEPVPPPKGAKAWALLAYLASTRRVHPRTELAELLFCEANDPLGALRWNLAALRRLVGRPDALKGDPIRFDLADTVVDLHLVDEGRLDEMEPGDLGPLLAGLSFPDSPAFELWLTGERTRLLRRTCSLLREGTLRALAAGHHDQATARARRLVAIDPLDEGHQALLIRVLAVGGDPAAALEHYEQCRALLQRELGVEPGGAIVAAAHLATGEAGAGSDVDLDAIDARMAIAWQSFLAGSVDHGIDLGRSVVAMADRGDDVSLQIMARLFLAAKLSIAVRGWDEGAASTTQALHLAEQSDRAYEEANARSVLAGIDLMRADYPAAAAHATIGAARCSDAGTRALNLAFLAAVEADTGKGAEAVGHALEAVAAAEGSHDPVPIAYATAYAGHALLLQGDLDGARPHVERAVEVLAPIHVLLPWPLAMLGEIEARAGRLEAAERHAARAGAVAATTDIAYQRALALRVEALVAEAQGETAFALDRLEAALGHARRTTGEGYSFHWPIAWILESLATISGRIDRGAARRWTDALLDHATATGMVTFVRRGEALAAADAAAVSGRP